MFPSSTQRDWKLVSMASPHTVWSSLSTYISFLCTQTHTEKEEEDHHGKMDGMKKSRVCTMTAFSNGVNYKQFASCYKQFFLWNSKWLTSYLDRLCITPKIDALGNEQAPGSSRVLEKKIMLDVKRKGAEFILWRRVAEVGINCLHRLLQLYCSHTSTHVIYDPIIPLQVREISIGKCR